MDSETVILNVGGTTFATTASTLIGATSSKSESQETRDATRTSSANYFSGLLSPAFRGDQGTTQNPLVVDRDPMFFGVILHYLRYGVWRWPPQFAGNEQFQFDVFDEMAFYGIPVPISSATLGWYRAQSRKDAMVKSATISSSDAKHWMTVARGILGSLFAYVKDRSPSPTSLGPQSGSGSIGRNWVEDEDPFAMRVLLCPPVDSILSAVRENTRPNLKFKLNLALSQLRCLYEGEWWASAADAPAEIERYLQYVAWEEYEESEVQITAVALGTTQAVALADYHITLCDIPWSNTSYILNAASGAATAASASLALAGTATRSTGSSSATSRSAVQRHPQQHQHHRSAASTKPAEEWPKDTIFGPLFQVILKEKS